MIPQNSTTRRPRQNNFAPVNRAQENVFVSDSGYVPTEREKMWPWELKLNQRDYYAKNRDTGVEVMLCISQVPPRIDNGESSDLAAGRVTAMNLKHESDVTGVSVKPAPGVIRHA